MGEHNLLTVFIMVLLALWGGTVNYISRLKRGVIQKFSVLELVAEWVISGFAGFLIWLLCQNFGVAEYMTAALVGIAGHMGGRTVFMLENFLNKKLDQWLR